MTVDNTGIEKFRALGDKSHSLIKWDGITLGIKKGLPAAYFPDDLYRLLQQGSPNTLSAPWQEYRHTPDVAVVKDACTANGPARVVGGQQVYGVRIFAVPLQLFWHLLFLHKDSLAHLAQGGLGIVPSAGDDLKL